MAKPVYKDRKPFTSSLKTENLEKLQELSKESRIPQTKLLDEAVEDLLRKHNQKKSTNN